MPRTARELAEAAAETEIMLDEMDADDFEVEDISDLRRIGDALHQVADGEQQLIESVITARSHGWSWARIGIVLGTTRQSAAERFGRYEESAVGAGSYGRKKATS